MANEKTLTRQEKIERFAASMVDTFQDYVQDGMREDDIYEFLDHTKDYRADCPEDVFDQATKIAVEIYEKKANSGKKD